MDTVAEANLGQIGRVDTDHRVRAMPIPIGSILTRGKIEPLTSFRRQGTGDDDTAHGVGIV